MNRALRIISYLVFSFSITGCLFPHRTPRTDYQIWEKPGQTLDELKEEMISCGYRNPMLGIGKTLMSGEDITRFETCMYRNGYRKNFGMRSICETRPEYQPAACAERDFIPPKPNP